MACILVYDKVFGMVEGPVVRFHGLILVHFGQTRQIYNSQLSYKPRPLALKIAFFSPTSDHIPFNLRSCLAPRQFPYRTRLFSCLFFHICSNVLTGSFGGHDGCPR